MEQYQKYCQLLGVEPGADAKRVRESFRSRIKRYHPDAGGTESDKKHAQLLIEAYSALKHGVPLAVYEDTRSAAASFWKKEASVRKGSTATHEKAYFAAKRMFENIFNEKRPDISSTNYSFFKNFGIGIDTNTEEPLYPPDEDTEIWEYSPLASEENSSSASCEPWEEDEESREQYACAETSLRQIVSSFEKRGNRFQRQWAREFIGDLAQVQVLYRDLCHSAPHLSYRALRRIRQISELITEIRKAL